MPESDFHQNKNNFIGVARCLKNGIFDIFGAILIPIYAHLRDSNTYGDLELCIIFNLDLNLACPRLSHDREAKFNFVAKLYF